MQAILVWLFFFFGGRGFSILLTASKNSVRGLSINRLTARRGRQRQQQQPLYGVYLLPTNTLCVRCSVDPTQWWSIPSTSSIVMVGSLGPSLSISGVICDADASPIAAECIYKRRWLPRPASMNSKSSRPTSDLSIQGTGVPAVFGQSARTTDDDAKLIFGTVFSLRNMVRKLGGEDDK